MPSESIKSDIHDALRKEFADHYARDAHFFVNRLLVRPIVDESNGAGRAMRELVSNVSREGLSIAFYGTEDINNILAMLLNSDDAEVRMNTLSAIALLVFRDTVETILTVCTPYMLARKGIISKKDSEMLLEKFSNELRGESADNKLIAYAMAAEGLDPLRRVTRIGNLLRIHAAPGAFISSAMRSVGDLRESGILDEKAADAILSACRLQGANINMFVSATIVADPVGHNSNFCEMEHPQRGEQIGNIDEAARLFEKYPHTTFYPTIAGKGIHHYVTQMLAATKIGMAIAVDGDEEAYSVFAGALNAFGGESIEDALRDLFRNTHDRYDQFAEQIANHMCRSGNWCPAAPALWSDSFVNEVYELTGGDLSHAGAEVLNYIRHHKLEVEE